MRPAIVMLSQPRRPARLSPRTQPDAGGRGRVDLPDDAVAAIVAGLVDPRDLLRCTAVSRQWRRVAQRHDVLTHHLARLRPGAALGLAPDDLGLELRRQAQVAHNLRRGGCHGQNCPLPPGLTMLRLSRSRTRGAFLVGQLPVGRLRLWSLDNVEAAPQVVARHDGALTCLSISAHGTYIASASSPPSLRGPRAAGGMVQLWRDTAPHDPLVLSRHHHEHVAAIGVAADGRAVVAIPSAPGPRPLWVWRLEPEGEISAITVTVPVAPGGPAGVPRLAVAALDVAAEPEPEPGTPGARELHARPGISADKTRFGGPPPRGDTLLVVAGGVGIGHRFARAHPAALRLGGRDDWRSCSMSPCGKIIVSRRADGGACIWPLYC